MPSEIDRHSPETPPPFAPELSLSLLHQVSGHGLVTLDSEGRIQTWNVGATTLLGYRAEEALGHPLVTLCAADPESAAQCEQLLIRVRAVGHTDEEMRWKRRDGGECWVHLSLDPLHRQGQFVGVGVVFQDITWRKHGEELLAHRQTRSQSIIRALPVIVWTLGPTGELRTVEGGEEFLHSPQERLLARSWSRLIHPEDRPRVEANWAQRRADPRPYELSARFLRADGEWRHMVIKGQPLFGPDGQLQEWVGVTLDMTERREAEERLRASEERLRLLVESSSNYAMYLLDPAGKVASWNLGAERLFGYTTDEILGQSVLGLCSAGEQREEVLRLGLEQARTEGRVQTEGVRLRKGGFTFWAEISTTAIHDSRQQLVGFVQVVHNISAQKKVLEELARLKAAVTAAANGILITDRQGTILWVNPAFTRLTGYAPEEVIGESSRLLKSGHHTVAFYEQMWETILQGGVWQGTLRNRRKDGTLYEESMTITPVHDAQNQLTHFIAIKEDITERKRLEDQLNQARKMEAIGQLAGGVAHDFNNLLTIIMGYCDLLLLTVPAKDPVRDLITPIREAGDRATSLTRQLLAFSRKQVLEPRILDLNEVVRHTEKMLRRLIGEDIHLVTALAPDPVQVKVDPGQMEQVIINLAVNARDAMPQGGSLTLATEVVSIAPEQCLAHPRVKPGPHVHLSVQDTGVGIPPEIHARLFEPFFTTKPQGKGTGLGLATVYGIVDQSEGFLTFESTLNQGTTFHVYLPRCEEKRTDSHLDQSEPIPVGQGTILLVEDEDRVRQLTRSILTMQGYRVLEAGNGQEALALLETTSEPVHLLITDVVMPEMSGRLLAENLRARHPGLKVLFVSGYTDDTVLRHGITEAVGAFLQKPFSPRQLARKVRDLFQQPPAADAETPID